MYSVGTITAVTKKMKVLGEKTVPTPLCQPQILLRLLEEELQVQKSATNDLS
jgi:hypothetical protein